MRDSGVVGAEQRLRANLTQHVGGVIIGHVASVVGGQRARGAAAASGAPRRLGAAALRIFQVLTHARN